MPAAIILLVSHIMSLAPLLLLLFFLLLHFRRCLYHHLLPISHIPPSRSRPLPFFFLSSFFSPPHRVLCQVFSPSAVWNEIWIWLLERLWLACITSPPPIHTHTHTHTHTRTKGRPLVKIKDCDATWVHPHMSRERSGRASGWWWEEAGGWWGRRVGEGMTGEEMQRGATMKGSATERKRARWMKMKHGQRWREYGIFIQKKRQALFFAFWLETLRRKEGREIEKKAKLSRAKKRWLWSAECRPPLQRPTGES